MEKGITAVDFISLFLPGVNSSVSIDWQQQRTWSIGHMVWATDRLVSRNFVFHRARITIMQFEAITLWNGFHLVSVYFAPKLCARVCLLAKCALIYQATNQIHTMETIEYKRKSPVVMSHGGEKLTHWGKNLNITANYFIEYVLHLTYYKVGFVILRTECTDRNNGTTQLRLWL